MGVEAPQDRTNFHGGMVPPAATPAGGRTGDAALKAWQDASNQGGWDQAAESRPRDANPIPHERLDKLGRGALELWLGLKEFRHKIRSEMQTSDRRGANTTPVSFPEIAAGPGTRSFYTQQVLAALRPRAGVPTIVVSADDKKFFDKPDAVRAFMAGTPIGVLPRGRARPSYRFMAMLREIVSDGGGRQVAIDTDGDQLHDAYGERALERPIAAILVVPGSTSLNENYFRGNIRLNFAGGHPLSPELLCEYALLVAAHEATHAYLRFIGLRTSEYRAETGMLTFLREHPEFFPILKDPEIAQGFILGARALTALFGGSGEDEHRLIGLLQLSDRDPTAARWAELDDAREDAVQSIAMRMYQNGDLHPVPEESFRAALGRATDPWMFTASSDPAHNDKIDLSADQTGLLAAYLQTAKSKVGFVQTEALSVFKGTISALYSDDGSDAARPWVADFMSAYGIEGDALQHFVESGEALAAPIAFQRELASAYTSQICKSGKAACEYPDKIKLIDPAHAFVQNALKAVEQLYSEGAFNQVPAQKAFAENLLAGARFFGIIRAADTHGSERDRAG